MRGLLANRRTDDLLLFDWSIPRTLFDLLKLFNDIHAIDHFTEDGVVHVQPWCFNGGDEELAAVGAGACVGHSEQAGFVEFNIACALVFEVFAPDRFASAAGPGRIAALNHEILNDAVKNHAIIVAVLAVGGEVFASLWSDVFEEFEGDRALGGFECDFHRFNLGDCAVFLGL